MENNYGFKYFNEEIVNEVVAFYDSKSDDKERASALKAKVKENYKKLDASLKEENKARLAQAKNDYLAKLADLDHEYETNMQEKLEQNKNADDRN